MLFTNCDTKDDTFLQERQKKSPVEYISLSDFNSNVITNEISEKLKLNFDIYKNNNQLVQSKGFTNNDLTIITDEIIKITKNDTIYYTFKTFTPLAKDHEFYNLIVYVNRQHEIFNIEMYRYTPDIKWLADINQPYKGTVAMIENEISMNSSTNLSRTFTGLADCLQGATTRWECNQHNEHDGPGPGRTCVRWEYIVTLDYGPCPDKNQQQPFEIVEEESSQQSGGGGTGTPNYGTPTKPTPPCKKNVGALTIGINDGSGGCLEDLINMGNQIFIDSSFNNNPCLKSVFEQVGKSPKFNTYLKNFAPEFSVAHLRLSSSTSLPPNINAETSVPNNFLITITFNENNLNRPGLSIARTMIHEMLHAEIFRKLLSASGQSNLNYPEYTQEEWENYIINLRNDFFGLYDYYTRWEWNIPEGENPSDAQHELMAQHYRNIIKQVLIEYDPNQTNEVYEGLALEGLMGTGTFNSITGLFSTSTVAWTKLSQQQRLNIVNIQDTFNISNSNCQNQ